MIKLSTDQEFTFLAPKSVLVAVNLLKDWEWNEGLGGASGQHSQTIYVYKFIMYINKALCKFVNLLGVSRTPWKPTGRVVLFPIIL